VDRVKNGQFSSGGGGNTATAGGSAEMCPQHNDAFAYLCHTCDALCCRDCLLVAGHKVHNYVALRDAAAELRFEITKLLSTRKCDVMELRGSAGRLDSAAVAVEPQQQQVVESVRAAFADVHRLLQRREAEICAAVSGFSQEKLQILAEQRSDMEAAAAQLSRQLEDAERAVKGSDGALMSSRQRLKSVLTASVDVDVIAASQRPVLCQFDFAPLQEAIGAFGNVSGGLRDEPAWMGVGDELRGFRRSSYVKLWMAVSKSNTWDPTLEYTPPKGYRWATTEQGITMLGATDSLQRRLRLINQKMELVTALKQAKPGFKPNMVDVALDSLVYSPYQCRQWEGGRAEWDNRQRQCRAKAEGCLAEVSAVAEQLRDMERAEAKEMETLERRSDPEAAGRAMSSLNELRERRGGLEQRLSEAAGRVQQAEMEERSVIRSQLEHMASMLEERGRMSADAAEAVLRKLRMTQLQQHLQLLQIEDELAATRRLRSEPHVTPSRRATVYANQVAPPPSMRHRIRQSWCRCLTCFDVHQVELRRMCMYVTWPGEGGGYV